MSTTPQSDPQAMPLADLKQAAGLGDPAPAPATPAAPAPPPPAPVVPEAYTVAQDDNGVTITLAPEYGGEVYKGKDANEALLKLAKAKADANAYIKQLKTQPAQPATPTQPVTQPEPVDPAVQATREWLIAEQAAAMGMTAEEYKARVSMVFQTTEQMAQNIAFSEFHRLCPDYIDTPENSAALAGYFADDYRPGDAQSFANDLKTAYALAVYEGKIKPQAQSTPAAPRPPVMPTAGATTPTNPDQGAWNMPLSDLKKAAGLG